MINLYFNPFGGTFDDFQSADLEKLRNVAEGWCIEYKSRPVSPKIIAKSLAAFANHYGGWIFYGIEEAGDGTHLAGAFPGIEQLGVSNLINDIKNAAKDLITPTIYYEYRKIDGPCDEVGLPMGKSIIVVGVPIGPDSPYIHNDGRIYRRIADSSDPKPETDKTVLDNLWNRRQKARERLAAFLDETPILSEAEENVSYLELILLPDPLGYTNQFVKLKFDEIVELLREPPDPKPMMCLKFDNFFAMADGIIARYVYDNDPYNLTPTWKFYQNGFSKILIPFSNTIIDELVFREWLRGYRQESAFIKLLEKGRFTSNFVIDINPLFSVVIAILNQNRDLLEKSGIQGSYFAKTGAHNIWRRIPFVDTKLFINFIKRHGIPVIQFDEEYSPPGKTFESLIQLHDIKTIDESKKTETLAEDVGKIIGHVFKSLGLPPSALFTDDDLETAADSLFETGKRASEVSKHRMKI
jgi:hypothetical protein